MGERSRTPAEVTEPIRSGGAGGANGAVRTAAEAGAGAGFAQPDPGSATFWDERFGRDFLPRDLACVPEGVHRIHTVSVRLPGCGSAPEALPVADSLPVFEGRESWLTRHRNGRSTASFRI